MAREENSMTSFYYKEEVRKGIQYFNNIQPSWIKNLLLSLAVTRPSLTAAINFFTRNSISIDKPGQDLNANTGK